MPIEARVAKYIFALLLLCPTSINAERTTQTQERIVREYVEAFNQKDVASMLKYAVEKIHWMSVNEEKITVETKGKKALSEALQGYFKSVPSIHSKILTLNASGPFVYTVEKAHWKSKDKIKSQCSPAIYQFDKGMIKYVWYFAAYPCD